MLGPSSSGERSKICHSNLQLPEFIINTLCCGQAPSFVACWRSSEGFPSVLPTAPLSKAGLFVCR